MLVRLLRQGCVLGMRVLDGLIGLILHLGQGGLLGLLGGAHLPQLLHEQARAGVFADSGAWETALLQLFDKVFRGGVWATLLPISDFSIGERAAVKFSGVLLTYASTSPTRGVFCVNYLLRGLGMGCTVLLGLGLLCGLGLAIV